jgi:tetratricopeptide (TPR) repeat protein
MDTRLYKWLRLFGLQGLMFFLVCCWLPVCANGGQNKPPHGVQVVLMRVSPRLEKQDYAGAAEMIVRLQAKAKVPDVSAMSRSPYHHPEIYFVLGNCYLLQNQYPQAVAAYRMAVEGNPGHTYGWLNLAKAYYEMQEYRDAGDCFAKGYETEDKKNGETLYYSAASFLMGEDYDRAIRGFAALQTEYPEEFKPEWKEYYVHALLAADRKDEAVKIITELIASYEGDKRRQWQEILLNQYMQQQDSRKALDYATLLTQESPEVPTWWKARAHIELAATHYEKALAALVIYGFLTPMTGEEQELLGDLYLQVGIPAKAAPVYAAYLRQAGDQEILYRLALAYDQLGQPGKSLQTLNSSKTVELGYDLYMLQGEISYRLHRYKEARLSFKKAAGCDKCSSGQAWLLAGYSALQLDDFPDGREAFNRAAGYDKERAAALKALQELEQAAMVQVNRGEQNR